MKTIITMEEKESGKLDYVNVATIKQ